MEIVIIAIAGVVAYNQIKMKQSEKTQDIEPPGVASDSK